MSEFSKIGRWLVLCAASAMATPARASLEWNMPQGVTPFSQRVWDLHMGVFYVCVVIGALVFGVMIWSMIFHRKSRGAEPAKFTHNTKVEIVWTTVPFIILFLMAIPATSTLIEMERTEGYEMSVKITGYQWMWGYEYVGEGVSFISKLAPESNRARQLDSGIDPATVEHYLLDVDKPLVLPVDTKIRFLLTAGDVIHSWWVPAFGWKRDAIPGYVNEAWTLIMEEGTYRGQCAELCGRDHGFMPIVVKAVSKAEFARWLGERKAQTQPAATPPRSVRRPDGDPATPPAPAASHVANVTEDIQREWTLEELMTRGEQVYTANCAACHQPNGQGMPPAFPSLVDSAMVAGPVGPHLDNVIHGVPGTAMQAFGDLGLLGPIDIAAVVTYERNAWDQNRGEVVQPSEVQARMNSSK